jgi:hypothetical protein
MIRDKLQAAEALGVIMACGFCGLPVQAGQAHYCRQKIYSVLIRKLREVLHVK